MGSWVLILTIMSMNAGTNIDHIKGFESEKSCNEYGQKWQTPIKDQYGWSRPFYSCAYVAK